MAHECQIDHSFLIRGTILVGEELLAHVLLLSVAQHNGLCADVLYGHTIKILVHDAETFALVQGVGYDRLFLADVLHVDGVALLQTSNLHLAVGTSLARQFEVLLGHALDESLVERLGGIKVIDEVLIVLHPSLLLALADGELREGGAIAEDELRLKVFYQRGIRLSGTVHAVGLVDDEYRACVADGISRAIKSAHGLVVVIAGEEFAVGNELGI